MLVSSIYYPNIRGWVGIVLVAQGLFWPHVAYLHAKLSPNKNAEYYNQYVDAFYYGIWCSAFNFELWPTVTFFLINSVNNLITGGPRVFIIGLLTIVSTAAISGFIQGSTFQPDSNTVTMVISGLIIYSYSLLIGNICRVYISKIQYAKRDAQNQKNELVKVNQDIQHLNEVIKTVNSTLNLDEIMDTAMQAMAKAINYNQMCLFIPDANSSTLVPSYFRGEKITGEIISDTQSMDFKLQPGISMISDAFLENKIKVVSPITLKDNEMLSIADKNLLLSNPLKAVMAYPLIVQGRTVGVIVFANTEEPFNELRDSLETLERYISQVAGAVNNALVHQEITKAKQLAESGTKAKTEFLANMSHEIRTPLNAILGLINMARFTHDNHARQDYLEKVDNSAHNLLAIINDVLDFSKIEAGKLELDNRHFKLDSVLSAAEGLLSMKATEKGLSLTVDRDPNVPLVLYGDELRLGQVLLNLLGNAIKFTEQGGITLKVDLIERTNSIVILEFAITDTGIGLSQEQMSRLFQSFTQADTSVTRQFGGTGLGLSISKHYIELMGGTIWVNSEVNKGSTFHFNVKFETDKRNEQATPQSTNSPPYKALIIDNDKERLKVLSNTLRKINYTPLFATTLKKAEILLSNKDSEIAAILITEFEFENVEDFVNSLLANSQNQTIPPIIKVLDSPNATPRQDQLKPIEPQLSQIIKGHITNLSSAEQVKEVLMECTVNPNNTSHMDIVSSLKNSLSVGNEESSSDIKPDEIAPQRHELANLKVLLVEDIDINQMIAQHMLEQAQVMVTIANNGQEALDKLNEPDMHFDAILMDIQMPVMDGHTATKAIRKLDGDKKNIPIIAMTAHAFESEKKKCFRSGMNDHIAKPISAKTVYSTLAKWTAKKDS